MLQSGRSPTITELAQRIEVDIRKRRLKPGDPYIGTAETARMLSVSTTAANRALQLLAKRRVIERKQRRGTFITDPGENHHEHTLQRIHLLVREDHLRKEGLLSDGVVIGMQHQLPGADVQFNFLRANDGVEQVQALVSEALASSVREGFLLVRSSVSTQRALAASGLPTVVLGSLQPSVSTLPWIDRDHRKIGRLLVEYALSHGHERLLLLQRDNVLAGDFELYDGVAAAMAQAGLPAGALIVRNLPADPAAITAEVAHLLKRCGKPFGIIARSRPLADGALAAAMTLKLKPGKNIAIAASDIYLRPHDAAPPYPFAQQALDPESIGRHIGRMFAQQAAEEAVDPPHEIIDVKLKFPNGSNEMTPQRSHPHRRTEP